MCTFVWLVCIFYFLDVWLSFQPFPSSSSVTILPVSFSHVLVVCVCVHVCVCCQWFCLDLLSLSVGDHWVNWSWKGTIIFMSIGIENILNKGFVKRTEHFVIWKLSELVSNICNIYLINAYFSLMCHLPTVFKYRKVNDGAIFLFRQFLPRFWIPVSETFHLSSIEKETN